MDPPPERRRIGAADWEDDDDDDAAEDHRDGDGGGYGRNPHVHCRPNGLPEIVTVAERTPNYELDVVQQSAK